MKRLDNLFLIIIMFVFMLCPSLPAYAAIESNHPGYEKVAFQVLDTLQAGQYGEVEAFFQEAHKSKRLTSAGREYMVSVFDRWYETNYYLTPALLEHLNGWVKQHPESPFALLARARYTHEQAWKARGGSWAYKVRPEQWEVYHAKLAEAYRNVMAAFQKDATIPYAYQLAVTILAQSGDEASKQSAKQFIAQAKEQQLYDMHGLHRSYMFYALSPRWACGLDMESARSMEEAEAALKACRIKAAENMLAYAREQAKNAPKLSLSPELIGYAHSHLADDLSSSQKKAYYAQPGVWEETQKAHEHAMAAYPKGAVWALNYGLAAYDTGHNDKAGELFNRAMQADPYYSLTFEKVGKLYMTPASYPLAEKSYRRYAELRPDDEEPYRQLAYIKIKQDKYQEAIALADQGIKINPNRCLLWAHRCLAHLKMNQLPQALQDCNQALSVDSQCEVGYLNRSKVYKAMGDSEKSTQDYATYKKLKGQ